MAIKVIGTTVIDNSRNIGNIGIATITTLNVGTGGTIITTTETGNVGINTNTPSSLHKLLVHDSFIQITNTVEGTGILKGLIIGYDASSNSNLVSSAEKSLRIATPANNPIVLQSDSSNTKRVGIGTTTPTSKLHVVGDTLITGIATLGTVQISSGIITATTGIVTYYGDGSNLSGVTAAGSVSISANTANQAQYLTYVTGTGTTTGLNVSTSGLTFNPFAVELRIGASSGSINFGNGSAVISNSSGTFLFTSATSGVPIDFRSYIIGAVRENEIRLRIEGTQGDVQILNTTNTSSATSGALQVRGGVGISSDLYVQGNARIVGAFRDSTNSAGTSGQILQSTQTGTQWTSSAAIGFAVSTTSGNYSISVDDNGKVISNSGNNAVWTIPTGLSTGFNATLFNNTATNQTFSVAGVTVYIAGSSVQVSGASALEQRGLASIVCVSSNVFVASGAGLR
jgi:hypothetical protein